MVMGSQQQPTSNDKTTEKSSIQLDAPWEKRMMRFNPNFQSILNADGSFFGRISS